MNLNTLALRRIEAGYAAGQFQVAVPFNPRAASSYGIVLLAGWFFLFAATLLTFTAVGTGVALLAFGLSVCAMTAFDKGHVKLPEHSGAQKWQAETYGWTAASGFWSPMATAIFWMLHAPFLVLPGFMAWWLYCLYAMF